MEEFSCPTKRHPNIRDMVSSKHPKGLLQRSTGALQIAASRHLCDFRGFASRPHGSQLTADRARQKKACQARCLQVPARMQTLLAKDTAAEKCRLFLWHLPVGSRRHMTHRASRPHTASAKLSSAISLHTQDPIDALQHRLRICHAYRRSVHLHTENLAIEHGVNV